MWHLSCTFHFLSCAVPSNLVPLELLLTFQTQALISSNLKDQAICHNFPPEYIPTMFTTLKPRTGNIMPCTTDRLKVQYCVTFWIFVLLKRSHLASRMHRALSSSPGGQEISQIKERTYLYIKKSPLDKFSFSYICTARLNG